MSITPKRFFAGTKDLALSILSIVLNLYKLMIPVIIVVKIVEELGGIKYIAMVLAPIMDLVGLPPEMGLVWATTLLSNLFAGMVIYMTMVSDYPLSVAQITVLGTMMLYAHSLPIELRITQKAGVRVLYLFTLRVGGALLLGYLLHKIYSFGGFLDSPSEPLFSPEITSDTSLNAWVLQQLSILFNVFIVIAVLVTFLRILKLSGIEKLMTWLLKPILKILGLSEKTTTITIIGVTLGIVYGGSLLINEAKSGRVTKFDVFGSLTLLSLCHSIIEDTLLILLLGADVSGALYFRVFFALIVTSIIIRFAKTLSQASFNKYLVNSP